MDDTTPGPRDIWRMMLEASDELADELGLGDAPFNRRSLPMIDRWVSDHDAALDEDDVTRLGLFLARLLVEQHEGGLTRIVEPGHPLEGEWAMSGFGRGLARDYHVPFMVSALRIGEDRSLTAVEWYEQLLAEGR